MNGVVATLSLYGSGAVECPDQSQNNTNKIAVFWLAESNGAVYTHEAGGFSDSHGEADADSLASDKER